MSKYSLSVWVDQFLPSHIPSHLGLLHCYCIYWILFSGYSSPEGNQLEFPLRIEPECFVLYMSSFLLQSDFSYNALRGFEPKHQMKHSFLLVLKSFSEELELRRKTSNMNFHIFVSSGYSLYAIRKPEN